MQFSNLEDGNTIEYSPLKKRIIRELSENSRISVTTLAKKLRCSRNTVIKNMNAIENEFGVHYTLEMNRNVMGFAKNMFTTIRFSVKPGRKELEKMFEDSRYLQFVAVTEGDFDVLIKQVGDTSNDYLDWSLDLIKKILPYRPTIKTSIVDNVTVGFMPLQSDIIEKINLSGLKLNSLDKKVLMLLNDNSRISYVEIAKKLKVDVGTVKYRFARILKSKVIKRFTLVMESPPRTHPIAFFMNFELAPGIFERARESLHFYQDVDEKLPLINSFQYVAGLIGSYSNIGIATFESDEEALKNTVVAFKEMFKEDNVMIIYARIEKVLKGSLPTRNIDIGNEINTLINMLDAIKKSKGNI